MNEVFPWLNAGWMLAWPVLVLGWARSRGASVGLWGWGALAFVGSQVVHIPLNAVVLPLLPSLTGPDPWPAIVALGLTSGLCEEVSRYWMLRWLQVDRWADGLMVGAGHGGVEALMVGGLTLFITAQLAVLRATGLDAIPEAQRAAVQQQVDAVFSGGPGVFIGGIERTFAVLLHVGLSMVALAALRGRRPWLVAVGVAWHGLANSLSVWFVIIGRPWVAELWLAANGILAVVVIIASRPGPEGAPPAPRPLPALPPMRKLDPGATAGEVP